MKILLITLLLTIIAADAEFKNPDILWSFLRVSSAEVFNFQPEILKVVLSANIFSIYQNGLTGIFDVKKDMDDNFEVCFIR